MDFTALCLALAAVCTRPSRQLHAHMPAGRLMSLPVLAPLILLGCCFTVQQLMGLLFVTLQAWYKAGSDQVSVFFAVFEGADALCLHAVFFSWVCFCASLCFAVQHLLVLGFVIVLLGCLLLFCFLCACLPVAVF